MGTTEKGSLSIHSENLFPIIKKWLYSDHDIFMRELISNGVDAITKLKKLEMMGEAEIADGEKLCVNVTVNPDEKTIIIRDNGIGMTADEVREYITQIAFSGATDFLEKYKDKTNEDQIIGHFGLGFYSAFMVAERVTIQTLSYKKDAKPVYWECDGDSDYTMREGDRTSRGTEITLYMNEESTEFCNEYRAREVIEKYCGFMPVEIYIDKDGENPDRQNIPVDELLPSDQVIEYFTKPAETEERQNEDGTKEIIETEPAKDMVKIKRRPFLMNVTTPLWNKHPNECTEDEYKHFYRLVFKDYKEPLFWIHLNMDYPFNLKGILYFPKVDLEAREIEGTIKLYNNQVFIADNIKEVIPEYLLLLKGVIDCPDLPLNVSRSALQNDGFVKKISEYISKKVSDRLSGMCKVERETFEKYWDDINPFVKYGCLTEEKFKKKMKDYVLYKDIDGKYLKLDEYLEAAKDKHQDIVFYVTDELLQAQYVKMFREQGMDAIILDQYIDQAFISMVEADSEKIAFQRVDTDLADIFKEKVDEDAQKVLEEKQEKLTEIFKKALNRTDMAVKVEKLKNPETSAMITLNEEQRRMQDMMEMYGMKDMNLGVESQTLILNDNNALVQYVLENPEGEYTDLMCRQLYDLALLSHTPLNPESMTAFIQRSNKILDILANK